jgi:hypothetical protein
MKAVNSIESFREAMDAINSTDDRRIGISVHDIPLEKPQKLAVI